MRFIAAITWPSIVWIISELLSFGRQDNEREKAPISCY